jgi:hypothetical protein
VRTFTLPDFETVNLQSFEEAIPVPFVHDRVTMQEALEGFFAQLTRVRVGIERGIGPDRTGARGDQRYD